MTTQSTTNSASVDLVDPRAPRFGQALTATGLLAGLVLWNAMLVYVVTVILVTAVLSGWRFDLYGRLWKTLQPLVGRATDPEPAAPHRFAKLLGAAVTAAASLLLLAGFPTAGFGLAGAVAALAGLAAATDICLGCRMYRQVSFFRRLGVV